MPPKRRREGGCGDGGNGRAGGSAGSGAGGSGGEPTPLRSPPSLAQALNRRCRSFDLETRGCTCCRHHQELHQSVQAVHRVETTLGLQEVKEVLTSLLNRLPDSRERTEQNLAPTYKLIFVDSLSDKIFTKRDVRAADGNHIKIRMISSSQQGGNLPCLLSTANVKIVVLDGDFNADNREIWTSEEFDDYVVRPRDRVGAVLTGKLDIKLENGEAYLHNVTFIDNSSFTRSRKFRLGVKLMGDLGDQVVQEGITEPFTVKDRRGEGYKKNDIPSADDELWRLKHIRKNGNFQQALERTGIYSVKDFLRKYHTNENSLHNVLSKASPFVWKTIVDHAKKCDPGSNLYSYFVKDKNIRMYFSSLGQIVGATVAGRYNAFGDLDTPWKMQVEESSKEAYEYVTYHQPDYEMYNSQPRPIDCGTLQGSITPGPKSTEPNAFSLGQWYSEQQVASQYASPFSQYVQGDLPVFSTQNSFNMDQLFEDIPVDDNPQFGIPIMSNLPADVPCGMTKLPSCRRWVKFSALVKWKAMVRASKRARLLFEQEHSNPRKTFRDDEHIR
ncbi:hypothetical protein EJB05_01163, partial [Eragrostis curvula]